MYDFTFCKKKVSFISYQKDYSLVVVTFNAAHDHEPNIIQKILSRLKKHDLIA
jgi:mannitol/fructose-specific phosphotransferase system IIA component (Ntr-type)